jgi:HSP20 family molecular chaperone IbpA
MSDEKQISKRETEETETLDGLRAFAPAADVLESADDYLVVADMPGVTQDAVEVHLDKNELRIEGRREAVREGAEPFLYRRAFRVPDVIEAGNIAAKLEHGVLTVTLPKAGEIKPRKIAVEAG